MFLPAPNALTLPEGTAPIGIGLEACNSGNSCTGNTCDNQSSGGGGCGWSLAGIVVTVAAAAL